MQGLTVSAAECMSNCSISVQENNHHNEQKKKKKKEEAKVIEMT